MTVSDVSRVEADARDERSLFEGVPKYPETIGNTALRNKLAWDPSHYWSVRNSLVSKGELLLGRGRGGSVRRPAPATIEVLPECTAAETPIRERHLYAPIAATIERHFRDIMPELRVGSVPRAKVVILADQGRRRTGEWSRPDIVMVLQWQVDELPETRFEVWTFEVKPDRNITIAGVFEARSHSMAAHRAFALYQLPDGGLHKDVERRLEGAASDVGVGLVFFSDASDFATWESVTPAALRATDSAKVARFLREQLPDAAAQEIKAWFGRQ